MKKNKDVKPTTTLTSSIIRKSGRTIKDVVPPSVTKNIRDNIPFKAVDTNINKRTFEPYAIPSKLPQDWPSEEEIKVNLYLNLGI
jgi:hypothetical protein